DDEEIESYVEDCDNDDDGNNNSDTSKDDPTYIEKKTINFSRIKFNERKIKARYQKPNDLISDGILEINHIKKHHQKLYQILETNNCLRDFVYPELSDSIGLNERERGFVRDYILYGKATVPEERSQNRNFYDSLISFLKQLQIIWKSKSYQERSETINEKSYSHQVVKPIMDFTLHNINNVESRYDGHPSEATQRRNAGEDGPIRYPDLFSYKEHEKHAINIAFIHGEISNGPFVEINAQHLKHISNDKIRLGKFAKDNLSYYQFFIDDFDSEDLEGDLYEFQNTMLHFHHDKMDIYLMDYELDPFYRMCLVKSFDLPLTKSQNIHETIERVIKLLNIIISMNQIAERNTRIIDNIDNIVAVMSRENRIPERSNVILTNATPYVLAAHH
ncbi:10810_t:CDS:2, partial [Ambispora gerdemannii]